MPREWKVPRTRALVGGHLGEEIRIEAEDLTRGLQALQRLSGHDRKGVTGDKNGGGFALEFAGRIEEYLEKSMRWKRVVGQGGDFGGFFGSSWTS
jgi:hypothetical protein